VSTTTGACAHAESRMQAYLDKLLSPGDALIVEQHLAVCSDCASAYHFEVKLRKHVKACCGGQADEDHCREELLAKLKSCCGGGADERTSQ
jgi:anti-sigma factor (TIGR02949 family)